MIKSARFIFGVAALFGILALPARADSAGEPAYHTGFSAIMKLGRDVYNAIKGPNKDQINAQPIVIDPDSVPYIRLLYIAEEPKPFRGVAISAGFVDLVNLIAHAKAIDKKEKGYFEKYIKILAEEKGDKELKPLPNDTKPEYWTEDMLNEQSSNFNEIVGVVLGITLAEHYLGYYDKFKEQLKDPNARINNLLTPKEWDRCLASGVRNSLDAGYAIEGVVPFFEAFDKMGLRPAWAANFVPDSVRFGKIKKDLEKLQKKFFANEE